MNKYIHIISYVLLAIFLNCSGNGGGCNSIKNNYSKDKSKNNLIKNNTHSQDKDTNNNNNSIGISPLPIDGNINPLSIISSKKAAKPNSIDNISSKKTSQPKPVFIKFDNPPEQKIPISPLYPLAEEKNGIEGVAYIQFKIGISGDVTECYVGKSSGNENLDQAAVDAVRNSKWAPAQNQGKPVSVWQIIPVEFKLTN